MLASTLVMYLALYAALISAYVSVLFHMARKAGDPVLQEVRAMETPQPVIPGKKLGSAS
jgi:cytochrome d ubiquinol oxidase subunit I